MIIKKILLFTFSILCMGLHAQDVPNADVFLPKPPVSGSDLFICDHGIYTEAKGERETARGVQARQDMVWNLPGYISIFADIIGLSEYAIYTSGIYSLLDYGMTYCQLTIQNTQKNHYRQRPYDYFSEASLVPENEDTYHEVSTYPAVQPTIGWLLALLLTEVCPEHQDQLLKRGLEFGPSTVIAGYNWDSDTYAGYLLASALLSRLHTHNGFTSMLSFAQSDYQKLKGSNTRADAFLEYTELPNSAVFLPAPPTTTSSKYAYDIVKYHQGKELRYKPEGLTAIYDVEYSADNFCAIYSKVLGVTISASTTPEIYKLIDQVHPSGNAATQEAKSLYERKRPYVALDESSFYPPDEDDLRETGSYPSGHASGSWLIALVLSEVTKSHQDDLMARAYQFGQGRVITGFHWQTDVDYGRLVGSAVYARLHTDSEFLSQMEKAAQEFKSITSGILPNPKVDTSTDTPIYTIDGRKINSKLSRHGIYIQNNQKIAY